MYFIKNINRRLKNREYEFKPWLSEGHKKCNMSKESLQYVMQNM